MLLPAIVRKGDAPIQWRKIRLSFGGGPGPRFSDKITSWLMSNFKETEHFDRDG